MSGLVLSESSLQGDPSYSSLGLCVGGASTTCNNLDIHINLFPIICKVRDIFSICLCAPGSLVGDPLLAWPEDPLPVELMASDPWEPSQLAEIGV